MSRSSEPCTLWLSLREAARRPCGWARGRWSAPLPPQPLRGRELQTGPLPRKRCPAQVTCGRNSDGFGVRVLRPPRFLPTTEGVRCQIIPLNFSFLLYQMRIKNSLTVDVCSVLGMCETLLGKLQQFLLY